MEKFKKLLKKFREDRQQKQLIKLEEREKKRQFDEESAALSKILEDPTVSNEDALIALRTWLDKWMPD